MSHSFSIIIPTLNEEAQIGSCLNALACFRDRAQIIVADGRSYDQTVPLARSWGAQVCLSPPGRGVQCNAGAAQAQGEFLIFLHADTSLPAGAMEYLEKRFKSPEVNLGTFRMRFDRDHWFLNICGFFTQYDTVLSSFGDQCIVVRRSFFETLGGFPDWPLFEDVEFLRRARIKTRICSFRPEVTTSARRFKRNGVIRQQLFNGLLILHYFFGASPQKLADRYRNFRRNT